MIYLKKYEDYKTDFGHYIEIDLQQYNRETTTDKIDGLKELLVGNIVSFFGRHSDKSSYENVKAKVTNIFYTGVVGDQIGYEFGVRFGDIHSYYKVDRYVPIKIHTLENNAEKYNL